MRTPILSVFVLCAVVGHCVARTLGRSGSNSERSPKADENEVLPSAKSAQWTLTPVDVIQMASPRQRSLEPAPDVTTTSTTELVWVFPDEFERNVNTTAEPVSTTDTTTEPVSTTEAEPDRIFILPPTKQCPPGARLGTQGICRVEARNSVSVSAKVS